MAKKMKETEIDEEAKKKKDVIYISSTKGDDINKRYRFVNLLFDQESVVVETASESTQEIKPQKLHERTLYIDEGGEQKISCCVYVDKNRMSVNGIHLSRRKNHKGLGLYDAQEIYLDLPGILKLKSFIDELAVMDFINPEATMIPLKDLFPRNPDFKKMKLSQKDFKDMLNQNSDSQNEFALLLELEKRRRAVKKLSSILTTQCKNEKEIIAFFQENPWIFNNEYLFFFQNGKLNIPAINESLPPSFEGAIEVIDVQLPSTPIFEYDAAKNYYPSNIVSRLLLEIQKTIFEIEASNYGPDRQRNIKPRGSIVIGDHSQLSSKEKQYLKILNNSYHNLKIVTYQDLLETAKNSVKFLETATQPKQE